MLKLFKIQVNKLIFKSKSLEFISFNKEPINLNKLKSQLYQKSRKKVALKE